MKNSLGYQGINDKTFISIAVVYQGMFLGLNKKGIERDLKTNMEV